ncbi:MAG TPA: MlaD family protein [Bacteroidia bacterium]|nr:MlaD family protein [Bacteroidia bacterium]HNS11535.1 MlaD family protein [Bacteroidia bacterium]
MMKLSKEVKIGIIVIAGILLGYWGINFLKGRDFFSSRTLVFAVYNRVDGLAQSNSVYINGMKVGMVRKLTLLPDFSGRILVSLQINHDLKIPRDSEAEIYGTDLLGTKGVRIIFGESKEDLQDGDTLRADIQKSLTEEVNSQVAPFKQKAESLLSSMDSVLAIVQAVFNETTKQNLKNSFQSISNSLSSIEHIASNLDTVLSAKGRLQSILANIESISLNLKNNNEKITGILDNFHQLSDTLVKANFAGTVENARKTLEETASIFDKVNKGEGSLGMLVNDDSLYTHLNSSARDLDILLQDIQMNPKRYLNFSVISFGSGKKNKKTISN